MFPQIEKIKDTGKEELIEIDSEYSLVSGLWAKEKGGNGERYTGLQKLDGDGKIIPKQGINLDKDEWQSLCNSVDEIEELLCGKQINKGEKRKNYDGNITMWQWVLQCKGKPDVCVPVCKGWYFSEEEAQGYGERAKKVLAEQLDSDDINIVLITEDQPEPDIVDLMRSCKLELLHAYVSICKKDDCNGCRVGSPSQKNCLKGGGCLDEDFDHISFYIDDAIAYFNVHYHDMIVLFSAVCKEIGISSENAVLLARIANKWIKLEEWIVLMNEPIKAKDQILRSLIKEILKSSDFEKDMKEAREKDFDM